MFAITSEQMFTIISSIALFILVAVLFTLVVLFYLRRQHQQRQDEIEQRKHYWQMVLFRACDKREAIELDPIRAKEFKTNIDIFLWVIQKWSQMHQYVRGDADDGLQRLADTLKFEPRILGVMKSDNTRHLIACCIALGDLQHMSAKAVIRLAELTDHHSSMVILTALRALMRYDAKTALPLLLKNVHFIAPERLVTILRECPPKLLSEATSQSILANSPQHAGYLLRVIKGMELPMSETFIRQILDKFSDNVDVVAATLALISTPKLLPIVRVYARSDINPIRIQATAALARLAEPQDIELLWTLLCDSSWWVRYRAAEGLLEQPNADIDALLKRSEALTDEYAKTMLQQVATEIRYGVL